MNVYIYICIYKYIYGCVCVYICIYIGLTRGHASRVL